MMIGEDCNYDILLHVQLYQESTSLPIHIIEKKFRYVKDGKNSAALENFTAPGKSQDYRSYKSLNAIRKNLPFQVRCDRSAFVNYCKLTNTTDRFNHFVPTHYITSTPG
jgi:hypothetical protein